MKKITVSLVGRPSCRIKEIKQSDGTYLPGNTTYWVAVNFLSDQEPEEVVGAYDLLQIEEKNTPDAIWEFSDTRIMLSPESDNNFNKYILTYDKISYKNRVQRAIM